MAQTRLRSQSKHPPIVDARVCYDRADPFCSTFFTTFQKPIHFKNTYKTDGYKRARQQAEPESSNQLDLFDFSPVTSTLAYLSDNTVLTGNAEKRCLGGINHLGSCALYATTTYRSLQAQTLCKCYHRASLTAVPLSPQRYCP